MHVNVCTIVGRISKRGPKLSYASSRTPTCEVMLEVDEVSKGRQVFTLYAPVEIMGKYAETAATELEGGDEIQVSGKLKYKLSIDPKTSQKTSKLIISTWGVSQRIPLQTSPVDEGSLGYQGGELTQDQPAKMRRLRYPKWKPSAPVVGEN
jgi:single-stranded DNA-binding protein